MYILNKLISESIKLIGLRPSNLDLDLWMKYVWDHYEYITIYYDDIFFPRKFHN